MAKKIGSTDGEAAGIYAVMLALALAFSYQAYSVGQNILALLMGFAAVPIAWRLVSRLRKMVNERDNPEE